MKTIEPNSVYIFAKPTAVKQATASGILLTDNSKEKPKEAEVINVGSGVVSYKSKDIVFYKEYASTEVKLEGETYLIINQVDILGKIIESE